MHKDKIIGILGSSRNSLFFPNQLSGLRFWIDSDLSPITEVSGALSQVNDLSVNGFHVTQSTASERPTMEASGIDGKRSIRFDRSNSENLGITGLTAATLPLPQDNYSFSIVCRVQTFDQSHAQQYLAANSINPGTNRYNHAFGKLFFTFSAKSRSN